ncbi:MAG: hypothetical protein L0177_07715, partial [Chloroflexi bacterium]|nr:hypothetical protein [Chloroflexota bacterium]
MSGFYLVFLVQRLAEFRYLGSVIEAAIERGHRVELWHDYSKPRGGIKDYQYPLVENKPSFNGKAPISLTYDSKESLSIMLEQHPPQCVIASRGATDYLSEESANSLETPWVGVQEHVDYVMFGLDRITSVTAQSLFTSYWMDKILQLYARPSEREALAKKLASVCRVTGSTQADGARLVDADEARKEMEIPPGKAVVVYLPTSASGASLYEKVFIASSKFRQAAYILRAKQWRNLRCLLQPFSDKALVKSVRRFCDANDAFLLVKTRRKQPLP